MDKDKIYFYQDGYKVTWIKIHSIDDERVSYIYSVDIDNIINIKVDKFEDFMEDEIRSDKDSNFIMNVKDLNKPFTTKQRNVKTFDLFNSVQDEIDSDYMGDIDLWLRAKRYHIEQTPSKKYKHPVYKNRHCNFKFSNISTKQFFNNNQILIPYNEVIEDYPSLNFKGLAQGVHIDSMKMVEIRRDQELKKLLSLKLI